MVRCSSGRRSAAAAWSTSTVYARRTDPSSATPPPVIAERRPSSAIVAVRDRLRPSRQPGSVPFGRGSLIATGCTGQQARCDGRDGCGSSGRCPGDGVVATDERRVGLARRISEAPACRRHCACSMLWRREEDTRRWDRRGCRTAPPSGR